MAETKSMKQSTFCWVDLETRDLEKARAFYGPIMGWEFKEKSVSGKDNYLVAKKGDDFVAGLFSGKTPHWASYIAVENVDDTVKKARTLGAKIIQAPEDWADMGRAATLRDPLGGEFCLWQGKEAGSAERNAVGSFCWTELMTTDRAKTAKFYTELFGWQAKEEPSMPNYTMFYLGETMVGGLMQITKDMPGVTPHWMVYFSVSDCDEAAKIANRNKAEIRVPPKDIPNVGRFSVIADPSGATFGVIKLLRQASSKAPESLSA